MDSGADSLLAGESGAAAAACSGSGSMATPQPLKGVAGAVGLGPDAANTSLGGGGGRGGSACSTAVAVDPQQPRGHKSFKARSFRP